MTNKKSQSRNVFAGSTKLLLCCFFIAAVIIPLIRMLFNLKDADVAGILSSGATMTALINSLAVSLTATIIAIIIAAIAAYCMTRCDIKLRGLFSICILLPMLIPSISHGMGYIILFGSNGRLSKLLGLTSGLYGFWGIVIGSVMYAFPVAYLMISDILKYEDSTPYEAAAVLGIPKLRRFTAITFPYMRKPMISVIFATFTMIVTDYGVPLMVGGMYKTLPVIIYEEVIGRQDFAKGSVLGVVLLIPAVAAFFADIFCKGDKRGGAVSRPFTPNKGVLKTILSHLYLLMISVCVVYPIVSFAELTFSKYYPNDMSFTTAHIESTMRKGAGEYLVNSLIIAFSVAVIGVVISFMCAYLTARVPGRGTSFLHLMSIISLTIPGIVLGLSYVLTFKSTPIYKTLIILIIANTIHFFSSPYLMIYNSMAKLNPNLESVGQTLGIGRFRLIRDVVIPQTRSTLAEMFSYFFVNSMMTISAVAFLAVGDTKPVALLIPQFEALMLLESSAFVSLIILAVNLLMKAFIYLLKHAASKRARVN